MSDFKCFACEELFSNINDITIHIRKFHKFKDNENSFKCFLYKNKCSKAYTTLKALKVHMKNCNAPFR